MTSRIIHTAPLLAGAALCAALLGCSREEAAPEARPAPVKAVAKGEFSPLAPRLKPDDVIIRVNGEDLTKADYDLWLNLKGRVFNIQKKQTPTAPNDESLRFMKAIAPQALGELVRRSLMRQAAEKAGVEATKEQIAESEKNFLEGIGRPKAKLSSLCDKLGPVYGPALKASVLADARESAYLETYATNSLKVVTDEELARQKEFVFTTNKKLEEKNEQAKAAAAAAKKEILEGGRMFADVANERAEMCPEQGKEWEVFELAEFEASNPLGQWLATADTGDISDPLDLDDGIAIVGVLAKTEGESAENPGAIVPMYELVRILFKAYDPIGIPEDDDEWRESMLISRRMEALQTLGKELTDAATIEFPSGNQLFDVKKPKAKKNKTKGNKKPTKKG